MAKKQSIAPFPADIDRRLFGAYVSGFVDGEGCFLLRFNRRKHAGKEYFTPTAYFQIALRRDDSEILELIRSFWKCGAVKRRVYSRRSSKPQAVLKIYAIEDLRSIIIPHFHHFPLYAKKQRDFVLWEHGIEMLHRVRSRPWKAGPGQRYKAGFKPKWLDAERVQFQSLVDQLKAVRVYNSVMPTVDSNCMPAPSEEPLQSMLFD